MAEILSLEIETNVCDVPYEKRFPSNMKLGDLKTKLELIVGAEAEKIKIRLLTSEGALVSELDGDEFSLKELGVKTGMRLFAEDTSKSNEDLKDDSMVEKYEMSEEDYNQREDSVRAWKKRLMAEKGGEAGPADTANDEAAKGLKLGHRCEVTVKGQMARRGTIAYVGYVKFKPGVWVGVRYDEPVGKNDGIVDGHRYFLTDPKCGGFVRPVDVTMGDFPEAPIDSEDEL